MTVSATFKRGDDAALATVAITDGVTPVDLSSGYTITWQVRRHEDAKDAIDVDVDLSDAVINLGAGTVTHQAGSGASLVTGSATSQSQGARRTATKVAANTWSIA